MNNISKIYEDAKRARSIKDSNTKTFTLIAASAFFVFLTFYPLIFSRIKTILANDAIIFCIFFLALSFLFWTAQVMTDIYLESRFGREVFTAMEHMKKLECKLEEKERENRRSESLREIEKKFLEDKYPESGQG